MILAGGYPSDNNGIYAIDEQQVKHYIDEVSTTYFDVQEDKLVTILKKGTQSGVALFKGQQKVAEFLEDAKPACFIQFIHDFIVVCYYHEGRCRVFDSNLNSLHVFEYGNGAKCHCAFRVHNQKQFGVVALGLDKIFIYDEQFQLVNTLAFPINSGVRHAFLSEDDQVLYAISEYSNEFFVVDMQTKAMNIQSILNTKTETTGAAIKMSDDKKHLYTSTRGADLITHFVYQDKQWQPVQYYACSGKCPRDFELFDDKMVIAYQEEDYMDVVSLDEQKNINQILSTINLSKIVCVKKSHKMGLR